MYKIFVIAGEKSGDIHAAKLISEIMKSRDDVKLYGVGGERLASLGQEQYFDVKETAIIGFVEVLFRLPFIFRMYKTLLFRVKSVEPDVILLVDYPGFNLRFAKRVAKYGCPVVYFIAPQVWVWHYSRVKLLRRYISKVLCILPFEESLLRKEGVNAVYVGNPVVDNIDVVLPTKDAFVEHFALKQDQKIIGILPGSRVREIEDSLPVLREAVLASDCAYQFVLGVAEGMDLDYIRSVMPPSVRVASDKTYDIINYSDLLWTCSGTVTLEAAIMSKPMVIFYKVKRINLMIGKMLTKLRMMGLPNIIAGKKIVPELLNEDFNPGKLLEHTEEILDNMDSIVNELDLACKPFKGKRKASVVAAEEFCDFM